jgi:hypothetical protein
MTYNYDCDDFGSARPDAPPPAREMKISAYLRVTLWARNRYTVNGNLIVMVGNTPSPFTRIERAAWTKYCA